MVAPCALTPLVPPGPGLPAGLLNAAQGPFRVLPPFPFHGHACILVWLHPNRAIISDRQSVGEPAPQARTTGPGYRAC